MELTKKVHTKKSTKTQCRRAKLKNKLIKNKGKKIPNPHA
jgi:hypothetical protein